MSRAGPRSARQPADAYMTPDPVAKACLCARLYSYGLATVPPQLIVEPSVGGGAFVRAARELYPNTRIIGVDIKMGAPGYDDCNQRWVGDWVEWAPKLDPDMIVGNPPFSHAQEHVEAAIATGARYVGFLLRLAFLESTKRATFWREHPPSSVDVLCKRPSFTGGGTDSAAYGWFVWRAGPVRYGETRLGWIWP